MSAVNHLVNKLGLVAVAAAVLATSACGSSGTSAGDASGPIVIGSVNTLTGAATFPEASKAAQAVFDQVNKSGGIDGRTIKYIALDDKGDPATAAQDARKLVSQQNAIALDGSGSLLDCEVNAAFYKQSKISSIPGTGVDPGCFASASIAPVNTGPYLGTQVILQYASEQLHLKRICGFFTIIGGTSKAYQKAVQDWSATTGQKLALQDESLPSGATDFSPYVLHAKQLGCDGIYFNGVAPMVVSWAKAMKAQGMTDVPLLTLSAAYTTQAAQAIGDPGFPLYSASEFAPYTDASAQENSDWRALSQANNIPLTSFSQGGYLAATDLVQVLKSIKGDITRDSVTKALRAMSPISNPMVGSPWVFGPAAAHNPNSTLKIVRLESGAWQPVGTDWVKAAAAK